MSKKHHFSFAFSRIGYIVLVFGLFFAEVCTSDDAAANVALAEARGALGMAERRITQLELELEQTRVALAKARSRYADLYLQSHDLLKSLRQTELQLANLRHNANDDSLNRLTERLLDALNEASGRQLDVAAALDEYEVSLNAMLAVLKPSEAMRRGLNEHLSGLRKAVEKSLKPLTVVNDTRQANAARECRIVDANSDQEIILVDVGSLSGMTEGTTLCLFKDTRVIAKFQVIDVRLEVSAAVLTEGSLTDAPVGAVLRLVAAAKR